MILVDNPLIIVYENYFYFYMIKILDFCIIYVKSKVKIRYEKKFNVKKIIKKISFDQV